MTQASRSEFALADDRATPPQRGRTRLSVASGDEPAVLSPALEMQRALDEMLTGGLKPSVDYGRGLARMTALTLGLAACLGFWWGALKWTAAFLG